MGMTEFKASATKWKRKLTNNFGLKIGSFLIAIAVWLIVVNVGDPVTTKVFREVPVKVLHEEFLADEGQVYQVLEESDMVDVTVRARRSVLKELKESDFTVTADMREMINMKSVRISVACEKYEDKIESLIPNHDTLLVAIEEMVSKELPVEISLAGTPAEGYTAGEYTLNPTHITVTGPNSMVQEVERVILEVNVDSAMENIEGAYIPVLYDIRGNKITNESLNLSNSSCMVRMSIWPTKSVAVEVSPTGDVATGFSYEAASCYPTAVTIAGEKEALSRISKIEIPEGVIDISGATEDVVEKVNIESYLPEGIYLVDKDSSEITVRVGVSPQTTRNFRIGVEQIGQQNVPEDYRVSFGDVSEVTVTLRGTPDELEQMKESDIKCTVNLSGLGPGSHQLPLEFVVSGNAEIAGQVQITVYIEEKTAQNTVSTDTPNISQ